jgi:hypothetical protein
MRVGLDMRKRWKLWAAGMALVLVMVGVGVLLLLWPATPLAEQKAPLIHEGMTYSQVQAVIGSPGASGPPRQYPTTIWWGFSDGSSVAVEYLLDEATQQGVVARVRTLPAYSVPPLTRLRRTLARIIPALGE